MTKSLTGKTAVITGASRGIGAAVAKELAKQGAHVVLIARTIGGLEAVDDEIRKFGGKATLMPLDLFKLNDLDALGPTLHQHFSKIDIFIGNAAMLGTLAPLGHLKPDEFQRVMDLNVTANYRLIRTLDPLLKASDAGRVVFVSSGITQDYKAYWGEYAVSKAALEALAKTYAAECANTNVKVNILDPGRVRTAMRAQAYPGEDPQSRPHPDEITSYFLKLVANDCAMNGEILAVPSVK
ncbi:MAG: oxidoreductase [Micavibrio aeruginosavorus]|uniref:Oxidoreductase n=1 Tax=Micavibrio aeruginosavorus TaxID=349221 RepID=A0A2W5MUZ1_9BACT|nr:MAG: oxidoreductase [Micavibrio aeruginosavorus]